MKRFWFAVLLVSWSMLYAEAQQVMFSNLKSLLEGKGDTVSILKVERRSRKQIYLMGGADYKIEAVDNEGLSKYLKRRCYAVQVDSTLFVNCRKMRYKKYRFGGWYAPAMRIGNVIFYMATPLGQAASSTVTPNDATRLGGEVGDAINISGLVKERVFYELDNETGRSLFVGKERMMELLQGRPELQEELLKERTEEAQVIGKYLKALHELSQK